MGVCLIRSRQMDFAPLPAADVGAVHVWKEVRLRRSCPRACCSALPRHACRTNGSEAGAWRRRRPSGSGGCCADGTLGGDKTWSRVFELSACAFKFELLLNVR
jgi:hypothetical protein